MVNKGFTEEQTNIETPNGISVAEKPLKTNPISSNRVDINVLKSKLRERENTTLRKNILILVSCLAFLVVAGVYVTYL